MSYRVSDQNRAAVLARLRERLNRHNAYWNEYAANDESDHTPSTASTVANRLEAAILAIEAGAVEVDIDGQYGVVVNGWLTLGTTSRRWRYRNNATWVPYYNLEGLLRKLVTDKLPKRTART